MLLNFFGWIFIYADRTILNPIMPNIQSHFDLNNSQLGLISSVFFLTYTFAQIPFAAIADYLGKKWVIGLGFVFLV
nr:MFS transporter [Leuconostoc fallax]